ncbi:MAG: L,D-transpeptidase family protein [Brevundimonas sp.]
MALGIISGVLAVGAVGVSGVRVEGRPHQLVAEAAARDPDLAALYARRDGAPIWLRDGDVDPARLDALERLLDRAPSHGRSGDIAARMRALAELSPAEAEIAISRLLVTYARDLRRPPQGVGPLFVDPALPPASANLTAVFDAWDQAALEAALDELDRLNPLYDALHADFAKTRDPQLLLNMDRVRALPADLGDRHVLVDIASSRLWLYEAGRPVAEMRVVVGAEDSPTPMLVGQLRRSVLQPYWNIPEDLVRTRFAPLALQNGPGALKAAGLQVLSDWTPQAHEIAPEDVDWGAVRAGVVSQRLRQAPSSRNMMGVAKFMLPNRLGIYLHDTPYKADFARTHRALSAGCVRVEDADGLFAWIHGRDRIEVSDGRPEQSTPLARPMPIYILYLTARPTLTGIERAPDIYGLDAEAMRARQAPPSQA